MRSLVSIVITFLVAVSGTILKGFVLSKLWGWFIVPYFSLPTLSVPLAIGVAATVSFLTLQHIPNNKKSEEDRAADAISSTLILPFVFLLIGWVVTFWL